MDDSDGHPSQWPSWGGVQRAFNKEAKDEFKLEVTVGDIFRIYYESTADHFPNASLQYNIGW